MNNRITQTDEHFAVRDFLYHLHDTLVLLGADAALAELLENPETIGVANVDDLRRYNGKLIDATKTKMINIHKLAIENGE